MFDTYGMEQRVRGAVAEGARLRKRGAFLSAASVALGVMGVFFAVMGMHGRHVEGALALFAFAAAAPPAVRSYWTWRAVRRSDGRIVDVVSSYAERFAASRLEAGDANSAGHERRMAPPPSIVVGAPLGATGRGGRRVPGRSGRRASDVNDGGAPGRT